MAPGWLQGVITREKAECEYNFTTFLCAHVYNLFIHILERTHDSCPLPKTGLRQRTQLRQGVNVLPLRPCV